MRAIGSLDLQLVLPIAIAIILYAPAHAGINGLLRSIAHRKTEI